MVRKDLRWPCPNCYGGPIIYPVGFQVYANTVTVKQALKIINNTVTCKRCKAKFKIILPQKFIQLKIEPTKVKATKLEKME